VKAGILQLPSGISGDMFLGALLDAGASLDTMREAVRSVGEGRLDISREEAVRGGLRATYARVLWDGSPVNESGGPAPPSSAPADPGPVPRLRDFERIRSLVEAAPLAGTVKEGAQVVFRRLAEAEAGVHGVALEEVHFHELGTWDVLADVVGVVAGLASLGLDHLYHGTVSLGGGRVRTAHGWLPVPTPATLALLEGRSCCFEEDVGELTTPTGAALVASLAEPTPPGFLLRPRRTGYGAGTHDAPQRPNLARLVVGEVDDSRWASVAVIEAALDDSTPEDGGDLLARLLEEGALDVTLTPLLMKKGRPGFLLRVLAPPERAAETAARIVELSSSLGARWRLEDRIELPRRFDRVRLADGEVRVKIATLPDGTERPHPEFEDVAALARRRGCAPGEVRREVERVWQASR
jgi:uncharacterized protein (TIGR00299 family) protein